MHTEQQIQDIGILNKGLQLLNIDVSLKPTERLHTPVACRFINNEDGSLRLIWPASSAEPQFLRFQQELTRRERWLTRLIRTGYSLRLPGLFSKQRIIYTTSIGSRTLQQLSDWVIYAGTPGFNRKMVIWHQNREGASAYTKLSLSIPAAKSIYAERMAIRQQMPEGVSAPEGVETRCLAFTQTDLFCKSGAEPVRRIEDLPLQTIQHWLGHSVRRQKLSDVSWYQEAQNWLHSPRAFKDNRNSEVLAQKVRTLMDCMLPYAMVPVALAHGGFTSKNVRRLGDQLMMIDWSLSREDMPALYDLFHFIYQGRTAEKARPFAAIRREIDEMLRLPEWEKFLLEHDIDPSEAEQQYLLSTVSYHLHTYSLQASWHSEVSHMMQVWCEALGFWMDYEGLLTQRQLVLQDIVHFLHDKPYAAMETVVNDITMLPLNTPLHLCMPADATSALVAYLRTHRCIERVRDQRQTVTRQLSLFLSSGSIIHLDCTSELRYRNIAFAEAAQTWTTARTNENGIKLPTIADDLRYIRLSRLLNGVPVPQQHRENYLMQGLTVSGEAADRLRQEGNSGKPTFAAIKHEDEARRVLSIATLKKQAVNRGFRRVWRTLEYAADTLRGMMPRRGFIISFSGMEGVGGKSLVIEAARHRIATELRMPVVVLRYRPSLLPLLEAVKGKQKLTKREAAITIGEHARKRSRLRSYLRFAYYYTDYLIGQGYVHLRYVMRGYAVLYDRYYLDFINDGGDSNVILPAAFTTWWYRFLLKPDLNFFLYEPAELVCQRKQELSEEDIQVVTGQYLALFNKLERRSGHGHYISVRNLRLGDTVDTLFRHIRTQEAAA